MQRMLGAVIAGYNVINLRYDSAQFCLVDS